MKTLLLLFFIISYNNNTYGQDSDKVINIKNPNLDKYILNYCDKYLDYIFKEQNIDSASKFWDIYFYTGLKINGGYYKNNIDDDAVIKKDISKKLREFLAPLKSKLKIRPLADSNWIAFRYGDTCTFLIEFKIADDKVMPDESLVPINLQLNSIDGSKTWLITQDEWIFNWSIYKGRR